MGAIEDLAPMLIGQDPTRIEHLYQMLYRMSFFRLGVIGMSAISGIEHALWDILGKSLNVPVYKLLGARSGTRYACIRISAAEKWVRFIALSMPAHW